MNINNLSDFSNKEFDPVEWVNSAVDMMGNSEDIDSFISGLTMKVQVLSQDCSDGVEAQMSSLLSRLPNMMNEIGDLSHKLGGLKDDIKSLTTTTKNLEKNTQTDTLSKLKGIQNKMKTCKNQLETILEWDQLCSSCGDAIRNDDIEIAASILEDMSKSIVLLNGLPDQEKRIESIEKFKTELMSKLAPELRNALSNKASSQLLSLRKIFTHLDIEDSYIKEYCTYNCVSFKELWNSCESASLTDRIQNYYASLHKWMISLSEEIMTLFNENEDVVTVNLLHSGCNLIKSEFTEYLARIPAGSFRHCLETAYSYIEIIVSGISDKEKKKEGIEYLMEDWFKFIIQQFVEGEYDKINASINSIDLNNDTEEIISTFTTSLITVLPTLLLELTAFEDYCMSLGHGILLPSYLGYISKIYNNLCSKYTTLLNRYSVICKQNKKNRTVLTDNNDITSFDWSVFENVLYLLLILDNFLLMLRHTNMNVVQFLQSNHLLFSTPCDINSMDDLLLALKNKDAAWVSSILSLVSSLDTLPGGVMLSPLQANYSTILSTLNSMVEYILDITLTPVEKVFLQMNGLATWSKVDASANYTIPSEYIPSILLTSFILPCGEHLLKIVEQLETVSSFIADTLSSFRSILVNTAATAPAKKGNLLWRDLTSELERLGTMKEKTILSRIDLNLKDSVFKAAVADSVTLSEYSHFSQAFLTLIAKCCISMYLEGLLSITNMKIGGACQLSTDIGYLYNIISSYDLEKPHVLDLLREVLKLNDPDRTITAIKQAIGGLS